MENLISRQIMGKCAESHRGKEVTSYLTEQHSKKQRHSGYNCKGVSQALLKKSHALVAKEMKKQRNSNCTQSSLIELRSPVNLGLHYSPQIGILGVNG
jgi:hypothetical protein